MSKKGKRNRSTPTKNNTGSPSTSPAQKAPRVEEPMATTSSGDQPDLAAIMAEVKRLQDQVKSMDGTVTQLRGEVADLKQAKETLETEVGGSRRKTRSWRPRTRSCARQLTATGWSSRGSPRTSATKLLRRRCWRSRRASRSTRCWTSTSLAHAASWSWTP